MKKLLLLLLPVALIFSACTKEKSLENNGNAPNPGGGGGGNGGGGGGGGNATYFMSAKVDGVAKTFNEDLAAIKEDTLGVTMYTIAGNASADPNNLEGLLISIGGQGSLKTGTYTVSNLTAGYVVIGLYVNADASKQYFTFTGDSSSDPFTVTITSVSATEVAGTFKGKLFESNGTPNPSGPSITITEGSFKAKIQ